MIKKLKNLHSVHYIPAKKVVIYYLDCYLKLILELDMHSNEPLINITVNNAINELLMQ